MTSTMILAVLKMFAKGRGVQFVSQVVKLDETVVRQIADDYGVSDDHGILSARVAEVAAAQLEQTLNTARTTLPTRDAPSAPPMETIPDGLGRPSPPRPKPAPPTPPATESVAARQNPSPTSSLSTGDVLVEVDLTRLRPDPDNPRTEVGDVTDLASSLRAVGLLQPIVARRSAAGHLVVVAGHRRLAAAKLAGWTRVQVIVRRDMRPDDVLAAMLVENSHRKDLDPIEEARGYARLKAQLGTNDAGVARRVGRHQGHVAARLILLELPIEDQEELRRGEMTLTEATDRARLAGGRVQSDIPRGLPHLGARHPLAARAKARCLQLKHARGRGQGVGGISCGECWESVIRADERRRLHDHSGRTGECAICGAAYGEAQAAKPPTLGIAQ